jgi:hypothetical protein
LASGLDTNKPLGRVDRAVQPTATNPAGPSPHQGRKRQVELVAKALAFLPTLACEQSDEPEGSGKHQFLIDEPEEYLRAGLFVLAQWSTNVPVHQGTPPPKRL